MKQKFYKFIYLLLIISSVLSYSVSFATIGTYLKFAFMALLITYLFNKKFNIRKYDSLFILLIPFLFIPFMLILFGRYRYLLTEQLINSFSYIVMILAVIACAELFEDKKQLFGFTQLGILLPLISILLMHIQEINLNAGQLFMNIISNDRIDRTYLGFSNPNMLGLVLMIALLCSMYFLLFVKKHKILNTLLTLFYIFLLLNTGSRTSIVAPFIAVIIYGYYYFLKKINRYTRIVFYCTMIVTVIIILFVTLNNVSFSLAYLDRLTSGRILRQLTTINFLSNTNRLSFGLGNLNSGALYSGRLPIASELNTDNSPIFLITTIGLVGLFFVIMSLMLIYFNIPSKAIFYKSLFFCWIVTALFEHTLFVPSSLTSLFFLVALQNINRTDAKEKNVISRRKYL